MDVTTSLHSVWRRLAAHSRWKGKDSRLPLGPTEQQSLTNTMVPCIGAFLSLAPLPTPHCVTWYTRTHMQYTHVHHIAWYIRVHVLHTQIGSLMSWDSSSEVQEGTVRESSTFLRVQLAHAGPLWFLTSGESVFFCISIPWAQEHNTHSLTATPILVKCNYISIFISVPCRLSVPCKHMKTLRIIKLRSYISFSMFKHRN